MKNLRWSVVALLVNLAIFYNIERLNLYQENVINIQSFVYVLGIAAIIVIIALPRSRRVPLYGWFPIWSAIYVLSRLMWFHDRPLMGGIHTYTTITEVLFLLISVFLSYQVTLYLYDFEEAVVNISFSGMKSRILKREEGWSVMQTEIKRGRRYNRPFSVAVLEPEAKSVQATLHRAVYEVQQALMSRYVFLGLARIVSQQMRRMDLAVEYEGKNRLVVMCPETSREGAMALVNRVQRIASQQLGLSVGYGVAAFPGEAVTMEELLRQAQKDMYHHEEQESNSPTVETAENDSVSTVQKSNGVSEIGLQVTLGTE